MAWLTLIVLLPCCVIAGNLLYTGGYRGAVSVLLFMGPFAYLSVRCFTTHEREFSETITRPEIRLIYLVCFVMAVLLGAAWGRQYALGPCAAALPFVVSEPVFQYFPF